MKAMHLSKKPMTFEEQLNNLAKQGLIINNDATVLERLQSKNYYRLNEYALIYKKDHQYLPGTTFEDIYNLYLFDQNLRRLLLACLEDVELSLRTRLAYVVAHQCGSFGYTDVGNFNNEKFHAEMMTHINREIRAGKEPFVKHYKNMYEDSLPIWVVVEIVSFGVLSKMYSHLKRPLGTLIADDFYGIPYSFLANWFQGLTILRNTCAHYGQIYNRAFSFKLALMEEQVALYISRDSLFALIVVLGEILNYNDMWIKTMVDLAKLLYLYPQVDLNCIGFPLNWQEILMPAGIVSPHKSVAATKG